MARRMLIDASHREETRVVVVDGTKLQDFDYEMASRKPLKGNIFLAKVIRIEPSLQAAFVEYGGNRHGFLAFSEIHPDYFQIPVADRERLIADEQRMHAEEEAEPPSRNRVDRTDIEEVREENFEAIAAEVAHAPRVDGPSVDGPSDDAPVETPAEASPASDPVVVELSPAPEPVAEAMGQAAEPSAGEAPASETYVTEAQPPEAAVEISSDMTAVADGASDVPVDLAEAPQPEGAPVEVLGGDDGVVEQQRTRERRRRHPVRQYKIQEVIKRRQILLVQVVKEERGNKGAALTTYLSLAGRYCVLMPNAGRGGGISRKISNPADRKRMKEMLSQLDVPQGMGVILRTAGLERSNIDIKRDYEYLSRLWDSIREITMRSTAPAQIYEEGDLIKRSLRDVYDTDISEVLVEGEAGFEEAREFMRQLVPHQADKVVQYKEPIPLFHRYQVESQFDAMHSPVVQLRSGGYIVINPTEALVAIDVNSGRSTKERNIEETALRTNIEAAEEIARQVRLRDLAGLIVIDFIDMEENRHQRQVEHKVKDAMRNDRARIQIGRISAFGLLEMSRQRLRPSLLEHSTENCPHCAGTGPIRSLESASLHALRAIEEEGVRRRASEIVVSVPPNVALYLLNQKRHTLSEIEKRYGFTVMVEADEELHAADVEIERVRHHRRDEQRPAQELARASYDEPSAEAADSDANDLQGRGEAGPDGERSRDERDHDGRGPDDRGGDEEGGRGRRRRRRRRRGRRDGEGRDGEGSSPAYASEEGPPEHGGNADETRGGELGAQDNAYDMAEPEGHVHKLSQPAEDGEPGDDEMRTGEAGADGERGDGGDRRRRRGRRGGRRRRREGEGENGEHRDERRERGPGDRPADQQADHQAGSSNGNWEHAASESAPAPSEPTAYEPPPMQAEAPAPIVTPAAVPAPTPVAAAEAPAAEAAPPPPVVPTISVDTPPEKPKRGWWRR